MKAKAPKLNISKRGNKVNSESGMFTLVDLTILESIKKKNSIHRSFIEEYKEVHNDTWMIKASLTLVNAVYTQKRGIFILTRDSLANLLEMDTNHKNKASLRKDQYRHFINHITKYILTIEKFKRYNREVMVCTVILPELLEMINVDMDKQKREMRTFVTGEMSTPESDILSIINRHISVKNNNPNEFKTGFKVVADIKRIMKKYKQN